jgi:hypothetical protein
MSREMMSESRPISAADKLRECERELKHRYRLYPGWIAEGKLNERQAWRQIAVLEEIAADYRAAAERATPQLPLVEPAANHRRR